VADSAASEETVSVRRRRSVSLLAFAALAALVAVALWRTSEDNHGELRAVLREPVGVMGTSCRLALTVRAQREERKAAAALANAEATLRRTEALLSAYLTESEIGRLNAAAAGETVSLSDEALTVLRAAERASHTTRGAFDVTVRPLIELWRECARRGSPPSEEELLAARAASRWDQLRIGESGLTKLAASARVDLGGIAKGFGIDWALADLEAAGAAGGLIDIGGDLRVFGRPPTDEFWRIGIRNPFGEGELARLRITDAAVCTSGNYARFVDIGGRRYSHIVDPRTARTADAVPAVTVMAPTAAEADVWATALSVLGRPGFALLPAEVEALLVTGDAENPKIACTTKFRELLAESAAAIEVVSKGSDPVDLQEHAEPIGDAAPDRPYRTAQESTP
jgi:thiamine biosynthesis lipoprotein